MLLKRPILPMHQAYLLHQLRKEQCLRKPLHGNYREIKDLSLIPIFVDMVSGMINRLFPGVSPEVAITYKLSAFHTAFNICNVLISVSYTHRDVYKRQVL